METECASCEVRTGLYVLLQVASISQLTVSRLFRHCGILNTSQPYRLPRPVTGIDLLYFTLLTSLRNIRLGNLSLQLPLQRDPSFVNFLVLGLAPRRGASAIQPHNSILLGSACGFQVAKPILFTLFPNELSYKQPTASRMQRQN
jgi:hypothetical protein